MHPYHNRYSLEDLHQGRVPERELYSVIVGMGKANMREAEPDIEPFLTSPDANLRYAAFFTLALWWQLPQHRQTAIDFLLHDPFLTNRSSGATVLGSYYCNTQDAAILAILAAVVLNSDESYIVRKAAYAAMHGIVDYHPRDSWRIIMTPEAEFDSLVDWDFVRSHAEKA